MIIYNGTKQDFITDVENQNLSDILLSKISDKMHRSTSRQEIRAWDNSLMFMCQVLSSGSIPETTGIAIEYNIPQTSKRVDFIISGYGNSDNGNVVIVELKQWNTLDKVENSDGLVETYTGGRLQKIPHPSYQAWSYAALIEDYNESVQNHHIELHPCAYLHNYEVHDPDPLFDKHYEVYLESSPAFTKHDMVKLRQFINSFIQKGDNGKLIYEIDNGKIKPSKSLQDAISSMVKGNKEFIMIDDQKVIYENIIQISDQCKKDNKKRTVIVKGGPGTGKTVVAINLLSELTKHEQLVQYVTKTSSPRAVYSKKLKGDKFKVSSINNMFKGSGSYTSTPNNIIDTILADEAHRLNEKSGMYHNQGENQIKEIIHSSKCSVFFIDEEQRVTLSDIGSIDEIKKWAKLENSKVFEEELTSQFRCNGSDGYLSWLDNVLEIRDTANYDLNGIDYDIRICDSPVEVKNLILEKNKIDNKSRMVAGYCWNWISAGKNDNSVHDIIIDDFEMSWNLGNTNTWAIDPDSVNEVGCIHTSQGLEFDYVGVIIGNDMCYRNGHIVTDYTERASTDTSLKGIKKLAKENPLLAQETADKIIKNTYRTLMTRGMKGCYVYCCDKELARYLKERITSYC